MMLERYADYLTKVLVASDEQIGFYERRGFSVGKGTPPMLVTSIAL